MGRTDGTVGRADRSVYTHVVSVSLKVPFIGIDNAGGEYVLRHYSALSENGFHITCIADASPENVRGSKQAELADVTTILLQRGRFFRTLIGRTIQRSFRIASLTMMAELSFLLAFVKSHAVRKALQQADLIELQWVEYFVLARYIKRVAPGVPVVGVVHDVLHQRFARWISRMRGVTCLRLQGGLAWIGYQLEGWLYSAIDLAITFSDKDLFLVSGLPGKPVAQTVPPNLEPAVNTPNISERSPGPHHTVADEPVVLFVGAFHRAENEDAALWMLEEIWPKVCDQSSRGVLYLVGADPSAALVSSAQSTPRVQVTGYVDELEPYYRAASLVAVPVRYGAGLKFKTATAMLWNLPIVATGVGAEGVGPPSAFYRVTDDAAEFATAVLELIENGAAGSESARIAFEYSSVRYSSAAFNARLISTYKQLLGCEGG